MSENLARDVLNVDAEFGRMVLEEFGAAAFETATGAAALNSEVAVKEPFGTALMDAYRSPAGETTIPEDAFLPGEFSYVAGLSVDWN